MSIFLVIPNAVGSTLAVWRNSNDTQLRDFQGMPLFDGQVDDAYDGDVVQLGYYSGATVADPFAGEWQLLQSGTIGDKGTVFLGSGRFEYGSVMPAQESLRLLGIPLSIRFFDDITTESASWFNAVSSTSGSWNVIHSADSRVNLTLPLDDPSLVWQGGSGSAFRTTIQIPEPASGLLSVLGFCLFQKRCRKRD